MLLITLAIMIMIVC
jgi:hypothetical protein